MSAAPETVLVVEDNDATAALVVRALSRAGFAPLVAANECEARDLLEKRRPAAVLLDHGLPGGAPWLLVDRARTYTPRVPVIMVTAAGDERVAIEAIRRGVDDYVKKADGFTAQLGGVVERVLRAAREEHATARLASIVASSDDAIVGLTLEGRVESWNFGATAISGFPAAEMEGEPIERVFPGAVSAEVLAAGQPHRAPDAFCARKDGRQVAVSLLVSPVTDASGRLVGASVIARDTSAQREAEERLREREAQFAEAQSLAHVGSWDWVIGTDRLDWSDESYRLFAVDKDTFTPSYEAWLARVHPDDRARTRSIVEAAYTDGKPFAFEHRVIWPDGQVRTMSARGRVVRDASGKPVRMLGAVADVTERHAAEDALRRDVARLTAIIETQREVATRDLEEDALIELVLSRANELCGGTSASLSRLEGAQLRYVRVVGESAQATGSLGRLDGTFAGLAIECGRPLLCTDVAADERPCAAFAHRFGVGSMIAVPLHAESRLFGALTVASPRAHAFGDAELRALELLAGFIGVAVTRAAAARASQKAAEAQSRLAAIVEASSDPIVSRRLDGVIESWNPAAERLFGYRAAEVVGTTLPGWVPADRDASFQDGIARLAAGEPLDFETARVTKDGRRVELAMSAAGIRGQAGEVVAAAAIFRDITDAKAQDRALRASLQEKEVLLQEVHHRVKNNLQIICSLLNLQSRQVRDAAALEAFRESQGRVRLMALFHEKLYRSRDLGRVDLGDYLRELTATAFQAWGATGAHRFEVQADELSIGADTAIPCGLIVNELVSNSLKHAFKGERRGSVRIELRRAGPGRAALVLRDDGSGLPADFDARRGKSLGLKLVETLTRQLGGAVFIEPGPGAAFRIEFPAD